MTIHFNSYELKREKKHICTSFSGQTHMARFKTPHQNTPPLVKNSITTTLKKGFRYVNL